MRVLLLALLLTGPSGEEPAEGWRAFVAARSRTIEAGAGADARTEAIETLAARWPELRDHVLRDEQGSRDDCFAAVQAALTLGQLGSDESLLEDAPRDLLRDAVLAAALYDDDELQANATCRLALQLRAEGELGEAEELLRGAATLPGAWASRPDLLVALAELERFRGSFRRAGELLDQAEAALLDEERDFAPHRLRRCALLGARGMVLLALGLPDQAKPMFEQELARARELGDTDTFVAALLHWSELLLAQEDFERLEGEIGALLREPFLSARARAQLQVRVGFAEKELERKDAGRPRRAGATLRTALAERDLWMTDRCSASIALAEVELIAGDLDAAEAALRAGQELLTRWERGGERLPPLQENALAAALDAALVRKRDRPAAERAAALERLRREFARFLLQWRSAPLRPGGLGFLRFATRRTILSELIELALLVEGVDAGLAAYVEAQELGSLVRSFDAAPCDLAEIRRALVPQETGVLAYLPAPDRSHLFVLARGETHHFRLARGEVLQNARLELVSKTLQAIGSPTQVARVHAAATRVRDEFLPPQARALLDDLSGLTIVGMDLFGFLPFERLPFAGEVLLGHAKALSYLPSLPLGVHLARGFAELSPQERDLVLLAGPVHSEVVRERWPELAAVRLSAEQRAGLLAPFEPGRAECIEGSAFRLSTLREQRAGAWHLLTHGVHDALRERPSSLLISPEPDVPDGLLGCDLVERLVAPPLVLLSACGSARGPLRPGDDGISHLGGAFLAAGARCVVLPSTDLQLTETVEFMTALHRALVEPGTSVAEALRRTRVERAAGTQVAATDFLHALGLGHRVFPVHSPPRASHSTTARSPGSSPLAWTVAVLGLAALGMAALAALLWRRRRGPEPDSPPGER